MSSPVPRLILVEFIQPGSEDRRASGALWRRGDEVHLLAPAPRRDSNSSQPENVLGRLDAACFAANDPGQVSRTCAANPERHPRCSPFDGSDRSLQALGEFVTTCRRDRRRA